MLKEYSLLALQKAINCALALDEDMPAKIQPLEGKVLEVVVNPLNVCFFLTFQSGAVKLLAYYDGVPDTVIHSSPLGLIRLSLLPASKLRSLFNDNIRISGDVALGQEVKALFDNIEIDWEGHLARFTGDVVAHQIGSWVREGRAFNRQLMTSLKRSMTEYLQEERKWVPSPQEMQDFFQDVDDLGLRLERLIAHFNQLAVDHEIP